MDKNHINLCLSGQSFRIVTDDDVDYVKQLEKRINSRIESYKKRYPQMSATRCTLLAMLELEDELARAKENYEALDAKISQLRNMPRNGQQMTNAERNLPTAPAHSSTGSTIENTAETAAESGTLVGG